MRGLLAARVLAALVLLVIVASVAGCSAPVAQVASQPVPTPVPQGTGSTASSPPSPADPTPAGPADEVRVTLGMYSGRPDPTWTLTGAEAAAVDRAIEALPEAAGQPPEGGLGYRGFTVMHLGRTTAAYRGVVWAGDGTGPQIVRSDPGRTVERLLLELGRPRLTAAEIAEVERSLAEAP